MSNSLTARRPRTRLGVATLMATMVLMGVAARVSAAQDLDAIRPADTSSPRATLMSFLDASNEIHRLTQARKYVDRDSTQHRPVVRRVVDCLDTSELPDFARDTYATEATVCLKEVLDRVELPPMEEVPDAEAMAKLDAEPEDMRWQIPGTRIVIAKVLEGPNRHEYLFTPGTVARAVEYYDDLKDLPYRKTGPAVSDGLYTWYFTSPSDPWMGALVERLPAWTHVSVGRVALWKWIGVAIGMVISALVMVGLYRLEHVLASRYRYQNIPLYCLTLVFSILATCVPLLLSFFAQQKLTIRGEALYSIEFTCNLVALAASLVLVVGLSNRVAESIIAMPSINPQGLDAQFIRILARLMSLVIVVAVFLMGGQYLGIPVTTLLASAGVGGLAVALAAQDTLKNLFGTIMLMADKPFRVGERIVFGKYDGVVEDIGLRSTRLRLLTGHQVTIPNDELARADIENVGRRPHIRRVTDIRIPLDTPVDKLAKALELVRETMDNHEGMPAELPPRVSFNEFNADSFNIRVICWYAPPKYWEFLAFCERVNMELCRAFEAEGIQFSLPMRVTHTSLDSEKEPIEVQLVDARAQSNKHPAR